MEDPNSSDATMRMCELLMANTTKHNTRICQLDVIVAILQEIMRSRVVITLSKICDEIFPEFKQNNGRSVLLVKATHDITLAGKFH
jgi:hypothetical protein